MEVSNVKVKMIRNQDGEEEEIICGGNTSIVGEKRVVSFVHDEGENGKNTHLLKISPNRMEWSKKGSSSASTEFSSGSRVPFVLSTPYGDLEMENHTHSLDITRLGEMDMEIKIKYSLYQGGGLVGDYDMKIYIEF